MRKGSESAGEMLRGIEFSRALPRGHTPISAAAMIKCLDADGNLTWALRATDDINEEELIGALTIQLRLLEKSVVDKYE